VDLQQVLLCTKTFASAVYYKRKLAVHNFTSYDLCTGDGVCNVWHEGQGGLDADEFATLIVDYFNKIPDATESDVIGQMGVHIRIGMLHFLPLSCCLCGVG